MVIKIYEQIDCYELTKLIQINCFEPKSKPINKFREILRYLTEK